MWSPRNWPPITGGGFGGDGGRLQPWRHSSREVPCPGVVFSQVKLLSMQMYVEAGDGFGETGFGETGLGVGDFLQPSWQRSKEVPWPGSALKQVKFVRSQSNVCAGLGLGDGLPLGVGTGPWLGLGPGLQSFMQSSFGRPPPRGTLTQTPCGSTQT